MVETGAQNYFFSGKRGKKNEVKKRGVIEMKKIGRRERGSSISLKTCPKKKKG